MVEEQRREVENSFHEYMTPLSSGPHKSHFPNAMFVAQEWQWAIAIISSRGFRHQSPGSSKASPKASTAAAGGGLVYTLVPILDMANHKARNLSPEERQKLMVRTARGDRVVYAGEVLERGVEFHNDYGVLSSEDLLMNYGYVPKVSLLDLSHALCRPSTALLTLRNALQR